MIRHCLLTFSAIVPKKALQKDQDWEGSHDACHHFGAFIPTTPTSPTIPEHARVPAERRMLPFPHSCGRDTRSVSPADRAPQSAPTAAKKSEHIKTADMFSCVLIAVSEPEETE